MRERERGRKKTVYTSRANEDNNNKLMMYTNHEKKRDGE